MANQSLFPLQINSAATGTDTFTWPGGRGLFSAEATFGGGTVSLQYRTGNATWVAVGADTTLTAAGAAGFILPAGSVIRAAITTATAVYAYAVGMS